MGRRKNVTIFLVLGVVLGLFFSCGPKESALKIDFEKYTLPNGLNVVLHQDKSDPITAVAILYHVGSNREKPGKTGFAHLFEHMMFQESEHVGQDQFFRKIQEAGGTLNGGTFEDGTIYFQVVPKNALEMVLWLESDRMGFLLPKVTKEALENQKQVVQNEKRQRVDNVPYGHTNYIIGKLLYPEGHPYNWQVIGSFRDLQAASVKDVHDFFKKWYGPNNATLVIAGDFDPEQTRAWVEKYFGEIPAGQPVEDPKPQPVTLTETKRAYYEDNFARSPQLTMVFPTVENYHPDSYALDMLGELLAGSKKAPLYKVIVEEKKLAPSVSAYQNSREIAGDFRFSVRAFPNVKLSEVEAAIFEALDRFEKEGFTEKDLERIKARTETSFYNGIASVLGKSFQLAMYNEYAGSPGFVTEDIQRTLAVTSDDIWRVFRKYIKGQHFVLTSVVPRTQTELVADNSTLFPLEAEPTEPPKVTEEPVTVEPLQSSFDRSVEPPKGPAPEIKLPEIWTHTFDNGLRLYGITHTELPLVQFTLRLRGGLMLDPMDKIGVANLVADLMMEGTRNRTPLELEEAIDDLGASISVRAGREAISLSANTLKSRLEQVYQLVEEILLEPRWDEKEFERIKKETLESINRRKMNPSAVASAVFDRLLRGKDNILAYPVSGLENTVSRITIDDLKSYYEQNFSPSVAHLAIVGDITKEEAIELFAPLVSKWPAKEVKFPDLPEAPEIKRSRVYFVDFPNARQSEIRIGYLALPYTHPDFYPVQVMNYKLGGSFNGIVNMILREEKGWTYGARTGFSGSMFPGPFTASAAVQSRYTFESVDIFKKSMENYRAGISEEDLEFTKKALIQSNARRFETLGALIDMLNTIADYNLPFDYIKQQEQVVKEMTPERLRGLAQTYIQPNKMIYLVVGDAKTQMKRLQGLGFGEPILLDKNGDPVK